MPARPANAVRPGSYVSDTVTRASTTEPSVSIASSCSAPKSSNPYISTGVAPHNDGSSRIASSAWAARCSGSVRPIRRSSFRYSPYSLPSSPAPAAAPAPSVLAQAFNDASRRAGVTRCTSSPEIVAASALTNPGVLRGASSPPPATTFASTRSRATLPSTGSLTPARLTISPISSSKRSTRAPSTVPSSASSRR